jgi:phosphoribosyl 1,2-cyclic phosphate phosphodiesterase
VPLPPLPNPTDIQGQLVFLGTGTSVGVPCIGCGCDVCQSDDPRNKRLRCSLALGLPGGTLLIDSTPDLRYQFLRERIPYADAILYTHEHTDHTLGLDETRLFYYATGRATPLYCEKLVEERLRSAFEYAFVPGNESYAGGVPMIEFHRIGLEPFTLLGQRIIPLRLKHGRFDVLGFRFGNIAYCTDTNLIPPESLALMHGLDVLIIDALRPRPHVSHFSVDEAVELAQQLQPKRTLFTHMGHEIDHATINAALPPGMELAYDGLRIPLT